MPALLLALLFFVAPALAFEPPPFDPTRPVTLVPPDQAVRTTATRRAVEQADHPTWIVVGAAVADGVLEHPDQWASETEEALELTWEAWSLDPAFDPSESSLILVALDEREVRIHAGARWDAELGLHTDALSDLTDRHFVPLARAGDIDGAIASTVDGLDDAIDSRLARAATAETARALRLPLGLACGGLALLGVLGLALFMIRAPRRRARRVFEATSEEWRDRLATARERFSTFRVDTETRDRLLELRLKGPVTTALFTEVTSALDEVEVGLQGLEDHLRSCEAAAGAGGGISPRPWQQATDRLTRAFDVDPEPARERLFDPPDQHQTVDPEEFMGRLDSAFEVARAGWDRLTDAVEVSLRRASDDLPGQLYSEILGELEAASLPSAWAAQHPLAPAPDAAWEELDELRRADPVAYLDALDRALEAEQQIGAMVDGVLEDAEAARGARAEALTAMGSPLSTRVDAPEDDPEVALREAEPAHAALETALAEASSAEEVDRLAVVAVDAWVEVSERRGRLEEAVAQAAGALEDADARLQGLRERHRDLVASIEPLLTEHQAASLADAFQEVSEADQDLDQAEEEVARGREALQRGEHLQALRAAEVAHQEHGQAVADLEQLAGILSQLGQVHTEAEQVFAGLTTRRAELARELEQYGAHATTDLLDRGDRARAALVLEWTPGPADWRTRLREAREVLRLWRTAVAQARSAWKAEQDRIRAERRRVWEEECRIRREEMAATLARSHQSSSSYRSTGSSWSSRSTRSTSSWSSHSTRSRSSSRSFSSFGSSRSGGSSFRRRGRSGGSSFRSKGRSGGSRW